LYERRNTQEALMKTQLIAALALAIPSLALAQAESGPAKETLPEEIQYKPLSVPGFDPGAKIAVLHGDLAGTGDYTLRLWFPAGYKFPAHWHPNPEHLTVLEGTLMMAMGDKFDAGKMHGYPIGSFVYIPATMAHYGQAKTVTVVQLNGTAPFKIELATPKP
jgi:quercetin dioxygenase-like cupin family protein